MARGILVNGDGEILLEPSLREERITTFSNINLLGNSALKIMIRNVGQMQS